MECDGVVWARVPEAGVGRLNAEIAHIRAATSRRSPLQVQAFDAALHDLALVDRWGRSDDMPSWAEGPDFSDAPELAALSEVVGDVVAFYAVDEGSQLGVYGHWQRGALARGLVYANDEWCDVIGEPQPWEAPLFSPAHLARALEDTRDAGGDEAAVRAAFAAGHIEQGRAHPRPWVANLTLLDAMVTSLRAPRWGFEPWPRRRDALKALGL
jgi:hypothetical protein